MTLDRLLWPADRRRDALEALLYFKPRTRPPLGLLARAFPRTFGETQKESGIMKNDSYVGRHRRGVRSMEPCASVPAASASSGVWALVDAPAGVAGGQYGGV